MSIQVFPGPSPPWPDVLLTCSSLVFQLLQPWAEWSEVPRVCVFERDVIVRDIHNTMKAECDWEVITPTPYICMQTENYISLSIEKMLLNLNSDIHREHICKDAIC